MSEVLTPLIAQAEELCDLHDHITRVIARLEIPRAAFSDRYSHANMADFAFDPVVQMFVYQHVRGFTQSELYRRLKGAAYVWIRFELSRPPTQQAINYIWRNRLSPADRRAIKATGHGIQDIASDYDIIAEGEPRLDPDTVDSTEITDDQIMDAVETARERGLDEFDSERASNATFEDLVFFERQAYLNMADRGTTTRSVGQTQRFERLSGRKATPHLDTHLRTMKQTATPPPQTTLDEYENGRRPATWQRIRDEVLEPFHRGVDVLLDSLVTILVSHLVLRIGMGALMTTTTMMIADYFDDEQHDTVMGWQKVTVTLAGVFFLPIAGVLASISW